MFAKLKTAWRAFNHWRRSAFPFRLTVLLLLLVFSTGLFERAITENHSPLINELVWIACKAIRHSSEPRIPSAYLHYYRVRENQRLQNALRDRIAGGLQLSPDELAVVNAMPSKVDNKIMFDIAKRHGTISAGVSQREYMRSQWAASLSMTAMEFDKDWQDVRHDVFNNGKLFSGERDWQAGVERFGYLLEWILIPLIKAIPWLVIGLTLVFIVVKNPASKRQCALAIALPILLPLLWNNRFLIYILAKGSRPWDYFSLYYFAYVPILAVIIGILGIRLRRWTVERGNTDKFLIGLLLIAGLFLIDTQCNYNASKYRDWSFPSDSIFCNISFGITLLLCLTGATMTGCSAKLYFQMQAAGRFKRFRIPPELLSYLLWGITAVLLALFLIENNVSLDIDEKVIVAGQEITTFICSVFCGLLLSRVCIKKYLIAINICALILLVLMLLAS